MSLLCLRHRLLRSTRLSRLVVLFIRVDESRENSLKKNLPVPVIPLDREAKGSRGDSPPTLAATLHALLQLLPVHAIAPHRATFALIQQLLVLTHAVLPQLFARAAVVPDLVVHMPCRHLCICLNDARGCRYWRPRTPCSTDGSARARRCSPHRIPCICSAAARARRSLSPDTQRSDTRAWVCRADTIREPLSTAKGRSRDPEKPTPPGTARAPTERAPTERAPSPMPRRPRSESLASNPIRSSRPNAERARRPGRSRRRRDSGYSNGIDDI